MNVLRHLDSLTNASRPVVLAAGFFDGVHRGHQAILRAARDAAAAAGGETWVLTFDCHPLSVLTGKPPLLLTCNKHKLLLLRRYGVDGGLLLPFTRELAAIEPEAFLEDLFEKVPTLHAIVVGSNWRFGHRGRGDTRLLRDACRAAAREACIVDSVMHEGEPVSSTRIRSASLAGDLQSGGAMLGRPVSILGHVVHGRGVGRELGYPTANLACGNEAVPPPGVYAVHAACGSQIFDGVLSFGNRPTFENAPAEPGVELHLLDYSGDLYGQDIEVFFVDRIRDEKRFDSPGQLRAEIGQDVEKTRQILAERKVKDRLYTHCYSVL